MKLYLLKMEFVIISVFYLFNIIMAQSDSPCPHIFNYRTEGGIIHGVITTPAPRNFQGVLNLEIQMSIGNLIGEMQGFIELITPNSQVEQVIQHNGPLSFKINFPYWINIQPKITKITLNENVVCVGEPIHPDLVRETTGKLTTVNLKFRLQISSNPSNIPSGVQPIPQDTFYNKPNNNVYPSINRPTQHRPPYDPNLNAIAPVMPQVVNKPFPQENPVVPQTPNYNPPPIQKPTSVISSSSFQSITSRCGIITQTVALIFGGEEVAEGANPWLAAIFKQKDGKPQFICGATIISNRHVITAGHCVSGVSSTKRFHLTLGRQDIYNWFDEEGKQRAISDIHIHPDYTANLPDADLAILVMSQEVQFTNKIMAACIWNSNINLKQTVGTTGVVAGWGLDESGQTTAKPKQITMPIVSEETCLRSADAFHYVTSNRTFCAGSRNNSGPCNGDSGGGFYVEMDNRWFIRGIVSHSLSTENRTCDLSNYLVFADIAQHREWIISKVS